jgi:hypothetical protein
LLFIMIIISMTSITKYTFNTSKMSTSRKEIRSMGRRLTILVRARTQHPRRCNYVLKQYHLLNRSKNHLVPFSLRCRKYSMLSLRSLAKWKEIGLINVPILYILKWDLRKVKLYNNKWVIINKIIVVNSL